MDIRLLFSLIETKVHRELRKAFKTVRYENMSSIDNQVETIGPGVTIAIAEQVSLILPKTPLPVTVRNSSDNCRVKVVSETGGNVVTGDWTVTSENEVDPGKELVVPVSKQPEFRSRVRITNLCNNESAEVIYTVG